MKKTFAKILAIALCAVLLVTGTVYITLAYLQSKSNVVTNTFTTSDIKITLDEALVNPDGTLISTVDNRTNATENANQNYKLMPGASYIKDPTVHVDATSENCFIVIAIHDTLFKGSDTNQAPYVIKDAEDKDVTLGTISTQMKANGWNELTGCQIANRYFDGENNPMADWIKTVGEEKVHDYKLYYFAGRPNTDEDAIVTGGENLEIIKGFTLAGGLDSDALQALNDTSFEVIAFGMQTTDYETSSDDVAEQIRIAFNATFGNNSN